jgi:hypothetical protein
MNRHKQMSSTQSLKIKSAINENMETKSKVQKDKKIYNEAWTKEQQILLEAGYIRSKSGELVPWSSYTQLKN